MDWMTADPSFAGPGAYYTQTPEKVFMGNEPCLPAVVVAKALQEMQQGMASPAHTQHSKKALNVPPCLNQCMAAHHACVNAAQQAAKNATGGMGGGGAEDLMAQQAASAQCMAQAKACAMTCPMPMGM